MLASCTILWLRIEKTLTQLDFRLSLVASLLEGHKRLVDRRHVAPTKVLPMRLSEKTFPEPVRRRHHLEGAHSEKSAEHVKSANTTTHSSML